MKPLALLPGLLCDSALWRHQAVDLADVAEAWMADLSQDYSIGDMARRVLAHMPQRFSLAGLSMGGYVAMEILRQAPQRVSRLALLNTKAEPDTPEMLRRRKGLIELAQKGSFKGVTPRLLPMLLHQDRLEDEELTGVVLGMAERIGKEGFLRQQKAILSRPDFRPRLSAIACPTQVICGRQDVLTPLCLHEYMVAAIPAAELSVIEDCGHLSPLEKPSEVSQVLRDWLLTA